MADKLTVKQAQEVMDQIQASMAMMLHCMSTDYQEAIASKNSKLLLDLKKRVLEAKRQVTNR